ncbi:MAG: DUF1876 domain-containing protein [Actinobacteria bacterium]|nr:DUF1876 domain-containing protein [Actinomycetota bacterium]MBU1493076.1 DUF1876 domain-containing protein [Actinomycetota bacterium]MBU1865401.1 DUF1876 domain-containing protein [Actinomycetota bacterium]
MQEELTIALRIDQDSTNTLVFAEMDMRGDHFESVGRARRSPQDRPLPIVGEELATARALGDLALQVMESAHVKIEQFLP